MTEGRILLWLITFGGIVAIVTWPAKVGGQAMTAFLRSCASATRTGENTKEQLDQMRRYPGA